MDFFNTYQPCKELEDIVELYWHFKSCLKQSLTQELHTPTFQALTFNLSGYPEDIVSEDKSLRMDKDCYLIGQPLSKRISISSPLGIDILGIKFTALGLCRLTGIDMKYISNQIIDATDIWGREIDLLYEEILSKNHIHDRIATIEHFLKKKKIAQSTNEKIRLLDHSICQIKTSEMYDVSELRAHVYTTKKTYERYFLNFIGVTPKQYTNICRFNNVCKYLETINKQPDWHYMVVKYGYYDQSHFIREFKRYSGKTPLEFYLQLQALRSIDPIVALHQIFG